MKNKLKAGWGETKTLNEWVGDPRCKVGYNTLYSRLRSGWEFERAATEPPVPQSERSRCRWQKSSAPKSSAADALAEKIGQNLKNLVSATLAGMKDEIALAVMREIGRRG